MTPEISLFLEKIKKSVIKCDIILKAKVIIDSQKNRLKNLKT